MRNRLSKWLATNLRTKPIRMAWLCIALSLALAWLTLRAMAWGQCSWYGYETSRTTRYSPFIGCMIQTPNGWIPRNELRIVQ